jgi:hypothetical protein
MRQKFAPIDRGAQPSIRLGATPAEGILTTPSARLPDLWIQGDNLVARKCKGEIKGIFFKLTDTEKSLTCAVSDMLATGLDETLN